MNNFRSLSINNGWGIFCILAPAIFAFACCGWSQTAHTNNAAVADQTIQTNLSAADQVSPTNDTSVANQTTQTNAAAAAQTQDTNAPAVEQTYLTNLTGIVIVASDADVKHEGIPGLQGLVIKGPAFLQTDDFEKLMSKYLNQPLTDSSAKDMEVAIIKYCRSLGHAVVDVFFAEQEVVNNTIQLAVIEGKIGGIGVRHTGHKWFSDELVLRDIHSRGGGVIIQNRLDSDMNWLNQNRYTSLGTFDGSFREVKAELTPGEKLGQVNITNVVADRFPFRSFVGYDNAGIPVIGRDQFFAGFEWANVFGLDQRLNYQYTTDEDFDKYRAHIASYTIPFPWQHELTILGTYAEISPNFSLFGPNFNSLHINDGTLYQISGRYSITLPTWHTLKQRITAGFDYKHINTPLFFGASSTLVLSSNLVDVAQFTLGYQAVVSDHHGSTALSLQGIYSPGGLTANNHNADYNISSSGNPNIHAGYFYSQVELRRETLLPGGFSWMLRGMGQISDASLYSSEVFGVGGFSSVRGYDERTVTGDDGWLVQNELRTPQFVVGNLTEKENAKDWVQGLVFCDYGGVIQLNPTTGQNPSDQLLSVGAGLRYQMAENFHLRVDYGYQLKRGYLSDPNNLLTQSHGQFEIGLEISY
jgi:hemolysin activation/secretion protein